MTMYQLSLFDIGLSLVIVASLWCGAYFWGKAVGFHAHLKLISPHLDRCNAVVSAVHDLAGFGSDDSRHVAKVSAFLRAAYPQRTPSPNVFDLLSDLHDLDEELRNYQPLTVRVVSFPESNGKRNWTAMIMRKEKWDGLIGNAGGITIARGEYWNRVAYAAEQARYLLNERDTEPFILDFGDDIETPEQWAGEVEGPSRAERKKGTQ
jgi:hypothetical protein